MRNDATTFRLGFSSGMLFLCGFTLAGCGRPAAESPSASVAEVTVPGRATNSSSESDEPAKTAADLPAENTAEATPIVQSEENPPDEQVHGDSATVSTESAVIPAESRLERARRVVETEGIIAKAVLQIAQGPPTPGEENLLAEIATKEQVYRLVAEDIDNDGQNLATFGLIMPWELRTRDVYHNLATGRSPFRRRVSSASLSLSRRIGDEQLESIQQSIDTARRSLLASRIRRAWTAMTSEQQALCDTYQPEFAAEASGRNDAELARLSTAIETAPAPTTLIARARLSMTRGDFERALDDVSRALSDQLEAPDEARILRAELLEELGRTEEATRDYQFVAEQQGPLSDHACVAWGRLLASTAPAVALEKAEEAIRINANCAAAYALMADLYKNMNLRQMTIESLQTAARLAPDDPTHFYRLGNLQSALGATDEAIEAYTLAIAADRTWWRPYAGRATLQFGRNDPEAALKDLQDASEWAPREPSIYENRAVVLEALGRADEAARDRAAANTLAAGGIP